MKVLILVATLAWSMAIHENHAMANDAQTKPTIRMYGSGKGGPANNVQADGGNPLPFFIVGLDNLCLEANRHILQLVNCSKDKVEQKWKLYADGSIRSQKSNNCLTANDLTQDSPILIIQCSPDLSAYQLWQLKEAGTIINLSSGLAIDVAQVKFPQKIILWPAHGGANQKWQLKLF
ncbi:unnamed protein product [Dovyalis caffra]|uniref:Ricin B lectin domain-containing protein n=1 Tax=Dovyalis caffra TaxID=77055 RepID=A0AAV1RXU0_9ROSI|nr:unnamed protein product [Dovyalis caffra]